MLKIRLSRVGKRKKPVYRMVVSENTKDMYGDHLEILGQYNPHTKDMSVKNDRVEHWLKMGAQASESVANLLMKVGLIKTDKKAKSVSISKKRQTKIDAKKTAEIAKDEAAKAAAEKAKEVVEAPVETAEVKEEVVAEEEVKTETPA
ncbi:30S ribosomal protein S16 [Patescibacteria group bacterium]|jgi:small subunit ribosomal protein S16|nr:30S ribosomal protein S16 [Patescibacteria group bacterium]